MVVIIPSTYQRKLLRVGDSIAVSLPPGWLRYYHLKVGDTVEMVSNGDVVVRVKPKKE